jgi:hypothetical protein
MKKAIEFFYKGPGAIILIAAVVISLGIWMRQKQDRKEATEAKQETKRELGTINPKTATAPNAVPQEVNLDKRELAPAYRSEPAATPQAPIVNNASAPLPTLVSFYAQVNETPTPSPSPIQTPTPRPAPEAWCPPSRFIPCVLVNTVNSSHINTPVVGKVERDVVCVNGLDKDGNQRRVINIPAGTVVSCFANAGAVRDRIEVAGTWLFVFPDNRSLKVDGIACDREADPSTQQFGDEDGSAGLRGELVESNHWANAQAFLALLMTTANQAITAGASGALSRVYGGGYGGGVALPDTSGIQAKYLDQLFNGQNGDARYVHVPASTEFYIFPTATIRAAHRTIDNQASSKDEEAGVTSSPLAADPSLAAAQQELQMLRQQQSGNQNDENKSRFHY